MHGESIALLEPLVEAHVDNIQYRVWLMQAYYWTKREAQLKTLLAATDEDRLTPSWVKAVNS